jgi:hypothetical protein
MTIKKSMFQKRYVGVGAHDDPFCNVAVFRKYRKYAAPHCRGVEGAAPYDP